MDDRGNTIGYEMRPLYQPLTYGVMDVLDIDYVNRNGKVSVYVRLQPSVMQILEDGGSRIRIRR